MEELKPAGWLEGSGVQRTPIDSSCFIGRSASGSIVLADEKVSRRHAMVQCQSANEFWLIDLGSANGTYLNGRRIIQPSRLNDGDQIKIGDHLFTFRLPQETTGPAYSNVEQTVQEIKTVNCWLLVADIESSTQLVQRAAPEELPVLTGRWLSNCKQIVEDNGGTLNKFLGDGFFAYWYEQENAATRFAAALAALRKVQDNESLRFRMAAHFGRVFIGGGASLGEESLLGSDVNFVFRMEKLAGSLGISRLLSEAGKNQLGARLPTVQREGSHPLSGFDGEHGFFSF